MTELLNRNIRREARPEMREYRRYSIYILNYKDEIVIKSNKLINAEIENQSKKEHERMFYVWKAFQNQFY